MIFTAPQNIAYRSRCKKSIFLAGSIEMGAANNWQGEMIMELKDKYHVFNPRRQNWDSSWVQSYENPQFNQQVMWELNALNHADHIVLYLDPKTASPISLLELGIHIHSKKLTVICPDEFYRKGNVETVCCVYNIPLFKNIPDFLHYFNTYE